MAVNGPSPKPAKYGIRHVLLLMVVCAVVVKVGQQVEINFHRLGRTWLWLWFAVLLTTVLTLSFSYRVERGAVLGLVVGLLSFAYHASTTVAIQWGPATAAWFAFFVGIHTALIGAGFELAVRRRRWTAAAVLFLVVTSAALWLVVEW